MPGILKVNQKVEVARSGEGEFYPALIQDVADDFFCITIPYLRGIPLVLVPGERVDVRVIESDAAYFFTAAVLGRRAREMCFNRFIPLPWRLCEKAGGALP